MSFFIKKKQIYIVLILTIMVLMVIKPELSVYASKKAIYIWINAVLPVLLSFFIFSNFLKNTGSIDSLNPRLYSFVISALSGYPMAAKIVNDYYLHGVISRQDSKQLLAMSFVTGPAFVVGTIGYQFLQSTDCGIVILISHYLGALINGFIYHNKEKGFRKCNDISTDSKCSKEDFSFTNLTRAIYDGLKSMGLILAFMILFMIITEFVDVVILNRFVSQQWLETLLKGMIELTIGCSQLASLNIDQIWKVCLASFMVSFGGLSVLCQGKSMLANCDIKLSELFIIKTRHGLISTFFAFIFYYVVIK